MSAQHRPRLSPEEYLELERAAEFKHEYYNGNIYLMAGGSASQAIISGNLIRTLGNALEKRPCTVTGSDLRIRVAPDGLYTYPDVAVACEPTYADGKQDTLLNPVLIIEVLSATTEAHDRGFKFAQYRKLETLREYVLVSQSEARVEVFRRQSGDQWLFSEVSGLDAVCHFESIDCGVRLNDVYNKVTFEAA